MAAIRANNQVLEHVQPRFGGDGVILATLNVHNPSVL